MDCREADGQRQLPDLADYSSTKFFGANASGCASGSGVWYSGDSTHKNLQLAMVNDKLPIPDTLSTVTPVDGASMSFSWQKFH